MIDSYDAEYEDHASTWRGFKRFMTLGVIFVVLTLLTMAAFLL